MTSGGIFTLIANDGKADNLIYATKLLNTRIGQIKQQNAQSGQDDPSPTLSEIERTHMLFVNAHFKPFVMIGFEYMKSKPQTAGMKLNVDSTSLLKYNIPQFGDFFSDMALHARIKNITDNGKYKYKYPQLNGYYPVWYLCTKMSNGDEHINYAVSYSDDGSTSGVVTNGTYKNGSTYQYRTYNRSKSNLSWINVAVGGSTATYNTTPSTVDLAVLALTCFVGNPNDLGVDVPSATNGMERVFPFELQDPWTTVLANTKGATSTRERVSDLGIGGWGEIENIWAARAYVVCASAQNAVLGSSSSSNTYNLDVTSDTANIRQSTGYLYYYGSGTDSTSVAIQGYNGFSASNSEIHSSATNALQLSIIDPDGNPSFSSSQYVKVAWVQNYVDTDGMCVPPGVEYAGGSKWAKALRFADNPGHRLVKDVKFTVNNNILDQYNTEVYNMYEKFMIKYEKLNGYKKLIGQQLPMVGNCEESSTGAKQLTTIVDGNQVAKQSLTGNHYFWVPLLFWFSKDVKLSIPSVSIPFGQRNIDVTLASLSELVYTVPAKLFRLHKTKYLYSKLMEQHKQALYFGTGYDSIASVVTDVVGNRNPIKVNCEKIQVNNADYDTSVTGNLLTNDEIDVDLYINNLFVTPEIHDIFIKRVGFNLIRVYVQQEITLTAQSNELLLSSLKWPIEYMCIGVKPNVNKTDPDNWHRYEMVERKALPIRHSTETGDSINYIKYDKHTPILESFGIKAHGVSLFDDTFSSKFYNAYLPWKYGAEIVTPVDDGIYMVNFCLYPGDYQPSGHINVSRAREFYFKYSTVSNFDPATNNSTLYIIASAINFLLISDGSAVLRYTT